MRPKLASRVLDVPYQCHDHRFQGLDRASDKIYRGAEDKLVSRALLLK
jgi:hypothetical protein